MTKDEALGAFAKAPKPMASAKDWESGTIVSAGRPQISPGNFITRIARRTIAVPVGILRGFIRSY